ncbi:MAG: BamA/TamA family outer membrane protein [Chitinophagales bacterium]|nr:BamA/TamA family outer membrane protein [Chitinophagales bacterium]
MRFGGLLLLLFVVVLAHSQNNYSFKITPADKAPEFFTKKFAYKTSFKDSSLANKELALVLRRLKGQGYLAVSVDSTVTDSTSIHVYMYVGEPVDKLIVQNGNIPDNILSSAGVKNSFGKPASISGIDMLKEKLIRDCENRGYPFATVWLDSFYQSGNYTAAKVYLQKNDLIVIDTIRILGQTKVKRMFLKNYLGLKTGKPYNESNVAKITQRLRELQFAEPIQPHTVEFKSGKAAINLYLKDRKASQFNGLIGFLPGSSGQKLLVTGEARIHLFSPFGVGEELYLEWQKLQPKTQRLDVRFAYPYLVGLPLGISARFELYKRDTTYLDLNGDYGIQYQIIGSNYLKASLRQQTTIMLNVDTAFIKAARKLPANLDISANEFALEYFLQKLDYRFNPVSGYVLKVNASAGVKQIKKNNAVVGLYDELTSRSFEFLYDTAKLKTFQFRVGLSIDKYWKLAARHTIKTSFSGAYFFSRNIFENEKYRLGGVSSLRGFDDQSIFTPYFAMANLEYRFLLSKNSYFHTFFNSAMVEDTRAGKGPFDFPFGFGAGAAIETKIGLFGITYAMGRQLENKLSFRSAKIHFGYVNYF